MSARDYRTVAFRDGILREPVREDSRLIFWIPASLDPDFQYWERIATVTRSEVQAGQGILTVPATSVLTRQRLSQGFFNRLSRKLGGSAGDEAWVLPNGQPVEKCGERRTDLVLAWIQDALASLDEAAARARWPGLTRFQQVGDNLFLIATADTAAAGAAHTQKEPGPEDLGSPVAQAEQILEAARRQGDLAREAAALTDLGIVMMNEGDLNKAVAHLERAAAMARQLGDSARSSDALHNLGYALLARGQAPLARQVLGQALDLLRQVADPYAEKLVFERMAMAQGNLGDPAGALNLAGRALEMTRTLGDEQQATRLLWIQAIAFADMNRREDAIAAAQASVELLRKLGKPEASWYGMQLQRYRMDFSGLASGGPGSAGVGMLTGGPMGGSVTTAAPGAQGAVDPSTGPGLLRMAVSATRAMMRHVGSGMKSTPADIQRNRMATCMSCPHHTGLRCRICGCFTNVKTRMAHEQCPVNKWTA